MWIERLDANHALAYRELMLEAYDRHPQAFTSSVRERALMPLSWWEGRLTGKLDVVLGAFEAGTLAGIVGLAKAIEIAYDNLEAHQQHVQGL